MGRFDDIKAREARASAGPWREDSGTERVSQDVSPYATVIGINEHHSYSGSWFEWVFEQHDLDFIAHARADVPWLVALVDIVRAAPCQGRMWNHDTDKYDDCFGLRSDVDCVPCRIRKACEE